MTRQSNSSNTSQSLFLDLWKEVVERTKKPKGHPSFVIFFVIAVLGFGALGIWIELYGYIYPDLMPWPPQPTDALRTAVLTFFPAVAGTAAMQLVWAESSKHFRSAAFLVLVVFLVAALLVSPSRITNESALIVGVIASLLSLWVWWIANSTQADLLDVVDPEDAVGGQNPEVPLPGSLNEFQH